MIERIELRDFKAFHHLDLDLRPITLLLGPNNAGKSSILAPLRLLSQTLEAGDRAVPLLLDGPLADFGTYRDVVHGHHRGRPMSVAVEATDDHGRARLSLEFKYRTVRRQLILRETTLERWGAHLITATYNRDSDRHVIARLLGRPVPAILRSRVSQALRLDHFLPWLAVRRLRRGQEHPFAGLFDEEEFTEFDYSVDEGNDVFRDALGSLEYISAMRLPPERTYHQTGESRARIGQAGENWTGLFVLDSVRHGDASRSVGQRVGRWLHDAGLAEAVHVNWLSDRHYEVQLQHPVTGERANLADVGQANSQILPVLVGGYRLDEGWTYLVEEPEIHLHPRAQAQLGDFFRDLHLAGVTSIVETHSEYLVLRIQQLVAAGDLHPDSVAFYYVYADAESGEKRVRSLTLDKRARFEQELPGGFFPERLSEARRLAKLRGPV